MPLFITRLGVLFFVVLLAACGDSSSTATDETGSAASTVTADPASLGSVQTVTSENYRAVIQQSFIPVPSINGKNLTIRMGVLSTMEEGGNK